MDLCYEEKIYILNPIKDGVKGMIPNLFAYRFVQLVT